MIVLTVIACLAQAPQSCASQPSGLAPFPSPHACWVAGPAYAPVWEREHPGLRWGGFRCGRPERGA